MDVRNYRCPVRGVMATEHLDWQPRRIAHVTLQQPGSAETATPSAQGYWTPVRFRASARRKPAAGELVPSSVWHQSCNQLLHWKPFPDGVFITNDFGGGRPACAPSRNTWRYPLTTLLSGWASKAMRSKPGNPPHSPSITRHDIGEIARSLIVHLQALA